MKNLEQFKRAFLSISPPLSHSHFYQRRNDLKCTSISWIFRLCSIRNTINSMQVKTTASPRPWRGSTTSWPVTASTRPRACNAQYAPTRSRQPPRWATETRTRMKTRRTRGRRPSRRWWTQSPPTRCSARPCKARRSRRQWKPVGTAETAQDHIHIAASRWRRCYHCWLMSSRRQTRASRRPPAPRPRNFLSM